MSPNFVAFSTIIIREVSRFTRIWVQTLLPPVITMTLYFLIFGSLIGRRVGSMEGYNYVDFIAPGLILMAVITNSYANVVSSFFGAKFQRHIEELLVSPVPNWIIILGYTLGGIIRGLMVGALVTLVALYFVDLSFINPVVAIITAVLTAAIFALAGLVNAIYAKKFDDINIIPTFVLTPLTYLGGVFYSLDLLSPVFRAISSVNPIVYMVDSFRSGLIGTSSANITEAYLVMLGILCALVLFVHTLFKRGTGLRQ